MDKNQMLLYESLRFLVGPAIKTRLRLKIQGQENVPDYGAAIIVCNHRSAYDPFILGYSVRNRFINFAAASWSWDVPVYSRWHQMVGAFPVSLSGGKDVERQLARGFELLDQDEVVGFFAEGGATILDPSKVERVRRFKTGFARLALTARVPIIPAAIVGGGERRLPSIPGPIMNRLTKSDGDKKYTPYVYKRATCRIGVPLDLGDLYDEPITKKLLETVSTKVRAIVIKLYDGEDLDRFLTGKVPFDFAYERIGGAARKLL